MMMPGNNEYGVEYIDLVVKKDIPALPKSAKATIKKAIETRLLVDPVGFGKPLRYSLKGHRCLRVGDYRVVYRIDQNKKKIIIIAIKHRRIVYEDIKSTS